MLTLVIGGARSGKSRLAQKLALYWSPSPVMVATARVLDEEFEARVERHRRDRGPEWTTFEADKRVSELELSGQVVVLDCATLWLTNWFFDLGCEGEAALSEIEHELEALLTRDNRYIIVTNELGQGPHAESRMARGFVDAQGLMNQMLARRADIVIQMVAGIPVALRGNLPSNFVA